MAQSGTYNFSPDAATLIAQAYGRIQVRRAELTIDHLVDARVALNLILEDISANRGVNLWAVDQIAFGLPAGLATFTLPGNTVDLLDVYLRTFTPSTGPATDLGNTLTAIIDNTGAPIVSGAYGDPVVQAPGSGVFSCVAGSAVVTMRWPGHGQIPGSPIFFGCPVTVGGCTVTSPQIVSAVIDGDNLSFMLPFPVFETMTAGGGTPLFYAQNGSSVVTVVQPGHGLLPGSSYPIPISTTVGGLILSGSYTVSAAQSLSQFTFDAGAAAPTTQVAFENDGQINVTTQAAGVQYQDAPLFPLSRTDYVGIPNKFVPGRPTSFWIDRIVPPTVSIYPVATANSNWGFVAYRMREMQDAIPVSGQTLDLPKRALPAVLAELTADVAEIWKPELWLAKKQAAEIAWQRFASADAERVPTRIRPQLQAYFR